jgi:uncharacterized protein DUF397
MMIEEIPESSEISWRTARNCDGGGCVMVGRSGDDILIGDTWKPDGPVLSYSKCEWQEFLIGAKPQSTD